MTHPQNDPPSRPWQYSMRTLLLVTLVTAVALAIVVSTPKAIAAPVMICLTIAIPALLTVVLVYGSGYQRTFCIGALFPTCTALYATGWLLGLTLFEPPGTELNSLNEWLEFFDDVGGVYRVYTACAWLLAIAIGLMAVAVRWHLEKRARRENKKT